MRSFMPNSFKREIAAATASGRLINIIVDRVKPDIDAQLRQSGNQQLMNAPSSGESRSVANYWFSQPLLKNLQFPWHCLQDWL